MRLRRFSCFQTSVLHVGAVFCISTISLAQTQHVQFDAEGSASYQYPGAGPFAEDDVLVEAQARAIESASSRCSGQKATRTAQWVVTTTHIEVPHAVVFNVHVVSSFECW